MPSYGKRLFLTFGFLKIFTLFNVWAFENNSLTYDFLCVLLQIVLKEILTVTFLGRIREESLELILAPSSTAYMWPVTPNAHVLSCTWKQSLLPEGEWQGRGKEQYLNLSVPGWYLQKEAS